jgi:hypothetical protein
MLNQRATNFRDEQKVRTYPINGIPSRHLLTKTRQLKRGMSERALKKSGHEQG